jgi:hypothetical protein
MMEFIEETRLQAADQATAVASGHHDAAPAPRAVCKDIGPVPYARTWFGEYGGRGTAPVVFEAELAGSQGADPEARVAGNAGRTCRKICCYATRRSGEFLRDRSEVRPAKKKPRLSPGPACRCLSREPHPTFRELAPKHWNGK